MYLLIIALILQVISIALGIYITHLQNDGRKGGQSEEDFDKQIKRLKLIVSIIQSAACICLLLNILQTQGVI